MEERGRLYLTLHCHHQDDSCIQMGSDVSRLRYLSIVRDTVTRQCPAAMRAILMGGVGGGSVIIVKDSLCPQTTAFEEIGDPQRNQTDVLLLTSSLRPYCTAKTAHSVVTSWQRSATPAAVRSGWCLGSDCYTTFHLCVFHHVLETI